MGQLVAIVGRPNVGKSNILEALALFDVPYMLNSSIKSLKNIVRIDNAAELFHNGISVSPIEVAVSNGSLNVSRTPNNGLAVDILIQNELSRFTFSASLNLLTKREPEIFPNILVYLFPKLFSTESS